MVGNVGTDHAWNIQITTASLTAMQPSISGMQPKCLALSIDYMYNLDGHMGYMQREVTTAWKMRPLVLAPASQPQLACQLCFLYVLQVQTWQAAWSEYWSCRPPSSPASKSVSRCKCAWCQCLTPRSGWQYIQIASWGMQPLPSPPCQPIGSIQTTPQTLRQLPGTQVANSHCCH